MKKEPKDWLAQALEVHESFSEHLHFLRTMPRDIRPETVWSSLKNLEQFLADTLPGHFRFEDEEIFPSALQQNPDPRLERDIEQLEREHVFMLKQAEEILDLIRTGVHPLAESTLQQLDGKLFEFSDMLLRHAHDEDERVFSRIKRG